MDFSITRAKILAIIKKEEPISITQLAKLIKLSSGTTIYRYVDELEKRGLITKHKEMNKRGKPTMLRTTSKAEPFMIDLSIFKSWGK